MSFFKMGKADAYKIFTSWDFLTYKSFELKEKTSCKEITVKLQSFPQVSPCESSKPLYLFVIVRETKQKSLLFKRKLNFFELPLEVYRETAEIVAEDAKNREILLLCADFKEFYPQNCETFAQIYGGFSGFFLRNDAKCKDSGYERAGELQKYSKKGVFKKKRFELSKNQLIYYNPKEKEKNINFIPLEGSLAEPFSVSKEKYVFLIRTYDKSLGKEKNFVLKAKSSMDMNGWVISFYSQAFMCTENRRLLELGEEILRNQKRHAELSQEKELKIVANVADFLRKKGNCQKLSRFIKENLRDGEELLEESEAWEQNTQKTAEMLRKHAGFARIFAGFLAENSKKLFFFEKPFVFDLKNGKNCENSNNFLNIPQKTIGKHASASDLQANFHKKSSTWLSLSNSYYKFSEETKT